MSGEKSEYHKMMDSRILDIEACIGEHLSRGVIPEILLATSRTIDEICGYLGIEPDWTNPEGRAIDFGDDKEIVLRIYRSVDVPYGTVIIR